ncbi:putative steroid C25 dehydrogenase-like alpha subunit [Sterolibacterium denitrificans]|uniref:Putative steroid C25 dehydrogenase-like alpha subunit n=1 Tax=Sterolibacterium denitrificans TaxID=157592 RepID=H9NN93_9PROT|nr:molybdopterin-dependent oxidoreductase [Sterolibacterium denitrificans]AFF61329.1 putative steroid C25 dehydrogenase-like alpha subunit [Sterolibacterium denitrificans]SMB27756.1 putative steroid C25 dehydrogenase-like alpha subunit [Sterolibacterium denitrificans]
MQVSRRHFIVGTAAVAAGAGLYSLRPKLTGPKPGITMPPLVPAKKVKYNDYSDIWREKWKWDKVVKGTHTRANCVAACSWDVYVRDGIAWREEQNTIYEPPRPGIPDQNPRGCQKGACYTTLQLSETRVKYPLKRVGERGEGKWKRITWDEALNEIADKLIDISVEHGTETICFDDLSNTGYGPETAGDFRFSTALQVTRLDGWSGVGDMPLGVIQTWGAFNCEGTSDDWFRSDYIVIWLGNPNYTRIPDAHFLHEARYRGAKLVVVSPDLNASTVHADRWIKVKPETDAALGLACAQVMIAEDLYKKDYVLEQTDFPFLVRKDNQRFLRTSDVVKGGVDNAFYLWDEAKNAIVMAPGCEGDGNGGRSLKLGKLKPALSGTRSVKLLDGSTVECVTVFDMIRERLDTEHTPEQAAKITGLHPNVIRTFAREMAAAPSAMIIASYGACKHYHSDLFQRSFILLMNLTGNQGKPGGGMRIAAWWGMDGMDAMADSTVPMEDLVKLIPKAIRGLTPRDYEQLYTEYSDREGHTPTMVFLYVHGGYKEMWDKPHLQDPHLPRNLSSYVRESIDKGWTRVHPPEDRQPRAYVFTGANPLRRWPSPQIAREKLWPKFELVVSATFKMSSSTMFADYVLPVAAYYEKYGIKYAQTYVPYIISSDKATEPLGESKSDWETFGLLARAVGERAKARGITMVRGLNDKEFDVTKIYDKYTSNGKYDPTDPEDPVRLMDAIFAGSPSVDCNSGREALQRGAVPVIAAGRPNLINQNYSDYDGKDTYWPHRDFLEKKVAWPTITGRQQFYIDHPWFIEGKEALPTHKEPPLATSKFPLRMYGGHNRWSIHSIWRDVKLLLRLQRGQPAAWMNPLELEKRGIKDGDTIKVYNDNASFECNVKSSPSTAPGEIIVYHAWEPLQFKNWQGNQDVTEAPLKGLHLAGGYTQLHFRVYYGSAHHTPRGAAVEVEKASA